MKTQFVSETFSVQYMPETNSHIQVLKFLKCLIMEEPSRAFVTVML